MRKIYLKISLFLTMFFLTSVVYANPVFNQVNAGGVNIETVNNATIINQTSHKAIISWDSFNIGQHESVHFQQPSGGIALNHISAAQGPSQILGRLTATGQIILQNSAGIYFGPNAFINVGGLIATTGHLNDADFLNGNYHFTAIPLTSSIVNEGAIIAAQYGLIALVGGNVRNDGTINASLGKVVLASGNSFTIDFSGDGLIHFAIDNKLSDAAHIAGSIVNTGMISVSSQNAQHILDNSINLQGVSEVSSVTKINNEIILAAGNTGSVNVSGKLLAKNENQGEIGGHVIITGKNITLNADAIIDVSGEAGGGKINIGGSAYGLGPLPNATQVLLMANTYLFADALTTGNGGEIVVWSDDVTQVYGNLFARGGKESGLGGMIETSGHYLDVNGITVSTQAADGSRGMWLLDPTNIYIAANQANATTAGMSGTDTSANTSGNPYQATGAVLDSLLLTSTLTTALASNNVTVTTTNAAGTGTGNIVVGDPITWSAPTTLTLNADDGIDVNGAITNTSGGNLTLYAPNGIINLNAAIQLTGGAILNQVITNGVLTLTAQQGDALTSTINATASIDVNSFQLLQGNWVQQFVNLAAYNAAPFNAYNFTIDKSIYSGNSSLSTAQFIRVIGPDFEIQDVYGLQGMGGSTVLQYMGNQLWTLPTGGITLDAAATQHWNWDTSINAYNGFSSGVLGQASGRGFDGNNGTISNLYINRPTEDGIGLFANADFSIGGFVQNVNIVGANITGHNYVGTFIGAGPGAIVNVTNDASTVITGWNWVGGMIGDTSGGGFSNITNNATVIGNAVVGGLVGVTNVSTVLTNVINNGEVTGQDFVGGIAGNNGLGGLISDATNNGSITGLSGSTEVGGIIGRNSGLITNVTNTAPVSGSSIVGGLVGFVDLGDISGTAANTGTVTGNNIVGGLVGTNNDTLDGVGNTFSNTGNIMAVSSSPSNFGGWIGHNLGTLSNFTLTNVNAEALDDASLLLASNVGGLVGYNQNIINNVTVAIDVSGLNYVGGVVGQNVNASARIMNSSSSGDITGTQYVGGLAGTNTSSHANSILSSSSSAAITGVTYVGGLAGQNTGIITDSTSSGSVIGTTSVGGLIGINNGAGSISGISFSTASVSGTNDVGGFIGTNTSSTTLNGATNTLYGNGVLTITGSGSNIGGFIGNNAGAISDFDFNSTSNIYFQINAPTSSQVGGIVGRNSGALSNLTLSNNISVLGNSLVGGLIGYNASGGSLSNITTEASVRGNTTVGGLIGRNDATLTQYSGTTANFMMTGGVVDTVTTGGVLDIFGGLIGLNTGTLNSFAAVLPVLSTAAATRVGGIVGSNTGTINTSYNLTNVTGLSMVGGLVGSNAGNINDSYSNGAVIATNGIAGGLIGSNTGGTLSRNYASGYVEGTAASGLVGSSTAGTYNGNFYDSGTTGQSGGPGTRLPTISLFTPTTFSDAAWNISDAATGTATTWKIIEGASYPYLRQFYSTAPRAISGATGVSDIGGNQTIQLTQNGILINDSFAAGGTIGQVKSGANGSFYFLEPTGTLLDGAAILAYSNAANVIMLMPGSGGSINNASLIDNAVKIIANTGDTLSNTTFANAVTTTGNLYTVAGNDITVALNKDLIIVDNEPSGYLLNGDITMNGGIVKLNGTLEIGDQSVINGMLESTSAGSITSSAILDLSAYTTPITINLAGGGNSIITGGISNIQTIIGGSANNTLVGYNTANTWNLTGNDGGEVNGALSFNNFQHLIGGAADNNFVLNGGSVSGSITGGGGNNTITGDNVATTWNITSTNVGSVTGRIANFSNIQNLVGGDGGNTFNILNNATLSGVINGGSLLNTNLINFASLSNPLTIVMSDLANGVGKGYYTNSLSSVNSGNQMVSFTNINSVAGNGLGFLGVPSSKANTIQFSSPLIYDGRSYVKSGFIPDPLLFTDFLFAYPAIPSNIINNNFLIIGSVFTNDQVLIESNIDARILINQDINNMLLIEFDKRLTEIIENCV